MKILPFVLLLSIFLSHCRSDENIAELTAGGKKGEETDISKITAKVDSEEEDNCRAVDPETLEGDSKLKDEVDKLGIFLCELLCLFLQLFNGNLDSNNPLTFADYIILIIDS